MSHADDHRDRYLSGEMLYGDDFTLDQIEAWYRDERDGYASLGARDRSSYCYAYHALNARHGFRHLSPRRFEHALGFGSAYGDELLPILDRIEQLTIVDSADAFVSSSVGGKPCQYFKPSPDGVLPFPNSSFDLILCLGVLHHIPNVSAVVSELSRCSRDDAQMLLREPIISMGDWTVPRPGLTRRERGIPVDILLKIVEAAGFQVRRKSFCMFPVVPRLAALLGRDAYLSPRMTWADQQLSRLFLRNLRYHATRWHHKLRPSSVYLVLSKGA